ncbi:MAG: thioredoxin domain-containing protein, partial [Candidatus Microthrix parvicella]|nr:thioredoxin domain-containing protein [Candidatus Microthrix parvicella]
MANRLANSTSPYLRQHAHNPVDWYPWGDAAFTAASERDVPLLISVGYSSCHWCHVMAHESFENPDVAARMNQHFINVKVDREERPDIDAVYMLATQAMTGHGGWPMTVLATPDGRPFFCGTYFPPEPRQGMPGFTQLIDALADAWTTRRGELEEQADTLA